MTAKIRFQALKNGKPETNKIKYIGRILLDFERMLCYHMSVKVYIVTEIGANFVSKQIRRL